jgi:hypothetical protein
LERNDELRKDGLEVVLKFLIVVLSLITLAIPPSVVIFSRMGLFQFVGTGLVTSLPGQLAVGLFWAYFFSIDMVTVMLVVFFVLIFVNSISRWLLEMTRL